MKKGISIYPGLDNTREENLALVRSAAKLGITRIFTSLQIPETSRQGFKAGLQELLELAGSLNMDVISDVSPDSLAILGIDTFSLPELHSLGLRTLRLDDGFTPEQIAGLSRNPYDISLQLNASVLNESTLLELQRHHCRPDRLEALHNFFPRENTGLSEAFALQKTQLLQSHGIRTGAFVPSFNRPRSPLQAGLPTLELHRQSGFGFAIRHLAAMGMDSIFIADSLPDEQELAQLAALDSTAVTLAPEWRPEISPLEQELCRHTFTSRPDEAQDVLRTCESRRITSQLLGQHRMPDIPPLNAGMSRPAGAITLDNRLYQRYQGELQIIRTPLPPDHRVNLLGQLSPLEQRLIKYITPGRKFRFIPAFQAKTPAQMARTGANG
ncbi:DUF871 domain-containing protein [Anaerovibrio sp.]|uniref:DUF871 domain-containing protein n=1 Tax=Anaerovibrio sp. TaxID=1872532 RepID=UPI003F15F597